MHCHLAKLLHAENEVLNLREVSLRFSASTGKKMAEVKLLSAELQIHLFSAKVLDYTFAMRCSTRATTSVCL